MSKDSHSELELSFHSDRNVVDESDYTAENLEDEQQLRQELIERATTRLRRRLLEQGLQDVMHEMASLQAQLDTLRLEAVATMDTMANVSEDSKTTRGTQRMNRQMDILEKRLESHKLGLFQLTSTPHMDIHQTQPSSTSMSRHSSRSLMSSLFGRSNSNTTVSQATSISHHDSVDRLHKDIHHHDEEEDNDDPFYDLAGKRSFKAGSFCGSVYHESQQTMTPVQDCNSVDMVKRRRQRRQRHRQSMERRQHFMDQTDSVISEDMSSISSTTSHLVGSKDVFHHPLSPISPRVTPIAFSGLDRTHRFFDNSMQSWLSDQPKDADWMCHSVCSQRNVLDDAMSFLDGLDENDDGEFEKDIYLLLQNPDLCRRPLSEIEATMKELRLQENNGSLISFALQLLKPSAWYQLGIKYSGNLVYQMACSSLQWCRFLSVLSAAVVISIMNGPDDIKRHSSRVC
ncbi:hypothetical protein BD560DRAFT_493890 [Blakeslea trispora]|nr:hypothetical protein BD560DRAFT_493890 [Blakeslea trispora]